MRLKLTVEYDGTGFHGWAVQPGVRTIEAEVRGALTSLFGVVENVAVAGRTDTGVHALGNVVSVDVDGGPPPERAPAALNAVLPDDVAVVSAEAVAPDFDARRSARSRSYRYRIWRRGAPSPFEQTRAWWFTPTETQHRVFTRNVLRAQWHRRGDALEFEITADSFLRHMVRTLVGTMVEMTPEQIAPLLAGRPRSDAGSTAPPHALYLEHVEY